MAHYELHAWCLLVLAWVFVPFYMRSMVFTMPEFLERRFSAGSRYVLSIVSLITFIVSKIAVGIFAGGVVFGTLLPELQLNIGASHDRQFLDRIDPRASSSPACTPRSAACAPWPTTTPCRWSS